MSSVGDSQELHEEEERLLSWSEMFALQARSPHHQLLLPLPLPLRVCYRRSSPLPQSPCRAHEKLGEWSATAISGNDILSRYLFVLLRLLARHWRRPVWGYFSYTGSATLYPGGEHPAGQEGVFLALEVTPLPTRITQL